MALDESRLLEMLSLCDRLPIDRRPAPEVLCPDDPDLREELRRRLALLDDVDRKLAEVLPPQTDSALPVMGLSAISMQIPDTGAVPAEPAPGGPRSPAHGERTPEIDGYEILGKLGEGGMGVVWRARQLSTRRDVALKVMSPASFGSERARQRFQREVDLTARLEHPHIARVYDGGENHGVYFYAMELIDGQPLDDFVKSAGLSRRQIIELTKTVCQAVQFAHQNGVIHRDLKPSNILVDKHGGPHVLDFGLAKAEASDGNPVTVTVDGGIAGTPAYMSPEQAAGLNSKVDTRSDVYSLGVILFRLLTGKFPHDTSGSHVQIIRRIVEDDASRLSAIEPRANRDLEALLSKALAKEPERRYTTAGELAGDLGRFLRNEPLIAQPPTLRYLFGKRLARHRVALAIAVSVCVLLLIAVGVYIHTIQAAHETLVAEQKKTLQALAEARAQRDQADSERAEAKKQATIAEAVGKFQGDMLAAATSRDHSDETHAVQRGAEAAIKKLDTDPLIDQPLVDAAVREMIGQKLWSVRQYTVAEPLLRRALEIRRKALPAGHPDIATSLNNLAVLLCSTFTSERVDEAERLYREALVIRRRALPTGHPDIVTSVTNLSEVLRFRKKFAEAESLQREALEIVRRKLPAGHQEIVDRLDRLALFLIEENKLAEAEPLYREALQIQRGRLPANLLDIAYRLDRLATLLSQQEKVAETEVLLREVLDIHRKSYPSDDPQIASDLNFLSSVLSREQKLSEAEALDREALTIYRKAFPVGDEKITQSLKGLAMLLWQQNKSSAVEQLYLDELESCRKGLPSEDPRIAGLLVQVGDIRLSGNRFAEAEPMFREAVGIDRKALPPDDLTTTCVISRLGCSLAGMKRFGEAEPLLREALARWVREPNTMSAFTKLTAGALTDLLAQTNRPEEAARIRDDYIVALETNINKQQTFDWFGHNELRHEYAMIHEEKKSMEQCDLILKNVPMDGYIVGALSAHPFDDKKLAVLDLLHWPEQYPEFKFVSAACWLKAAELESDPVKAREYLQKVLSLAGDDLEPYRKRATAQLKDR